MGLPVADKEVVQVERSQVDFYCKKCPNFIKRGRLVEKGYYKGIRDRLADMFQIYVKSATRCDSLDCFIPGAIKRVRRI